MLTRLLVRRFTSQYCLYKNLGAPNFCAGAPKKKKLGAPVHPVQNVSLEPCVRFPSGSLAHEMR